MIPIVVKATGDTLTAEEFDSAIVYEEEGVIQSTSQVLSGLDNFQLSKAIAAYSTVGDFCQDTGVANSYALIPVSPMQPSPFYYNGMRLRFRAGNSNTSASSVNYASIGLKSIKKSGGASDLTANDIVSGQICEIIYNSSGSGFFELNPNSMTSLARRLTKKVDGLKLSNNITNPNDIDFSSGCFVDTTFANIFYSAGMTKKLTGSGWVAGTGNCGRPSTVTLSPSTWYHAFSIAKSDGTVDFGFDTSVTAANLLAEATGYIYYFRITSILTDPSSNTIEFYHNPKNNKIEWFDPINNYYGKSSYTAWTTTQLTVPIGVAVEANLGYKFISSNTGGGLRAVVVKPDALQDYLNWGDDRCKLTVGVGITDLNDGSTLDHVETNTSAQIWHRVNIDLTTYTTVFRIDTYGWTELY